MIRVSKTTRIRHERDRLGDGHSRRAYSEIHLDERDSTCAGSLARAIAYFADRGIRQKFIKPHCPWSTPTLNAATARSEVTSAGWPFHVKHHRCSSSTAAATSAPAALLRCVPRETSPL
ncbi:hypothetical protein Amsp01_024290 [Amycolatopsis sp. NBRC 101858]|nr:hypothetical protein Amsp01_024290 [Amycolatopsis sp. NBRC 101858]